MKLTSIIAVLAFAFVANANEPAAPAPAKKKAKNTKKVTKQKLLLLKELSNLLLSLLETSKKAKLYAWLFYFVNHFSILNTKTDLVRKNILL